MKKLITILSLAALTVGLLSSCNKEDPNTGATDANQPEDASGFVNKDLTPEVGAWD